MKLAWVFVAAAAIVLVVGSGINEAVMAPLDIVRPLPAQLENLEMRIVTVDLAPGQGSSPHRHNAHVYVYVLEGTVEMQVEGGPLMRLGPGEMFFETPDDVHSVSRNASATEPAKILVHMLKPAGAPPTVPAK